MARLISAKDLYILQVVIIIIFLWIAIWNLTEIAIDNIQERTQFDRWKLYVGLLVIVLVIIMFDPYIFEKL
jgi:hypothetical protein